jgi:hypothetical protein
MRESGVKVEGSFIPPPRVEVEEPGISDRAKRLNAETARLAARGAKNGAESLSKSIFIAGTCVKSSEDEEFHALLRIMQ